MPVALVALFVLRARTLLRDAEARRRGHVTICACALVLLPLALTAERNVPPFLLLAVPAIAPLTRSTGSESTPEDDTPQPYPQHPRLTDAIPPVSGAAGFGTLTTSTRIPI